MMKRLSMRARVRIATVGVVGVVAAGGLGVSAGTANAAPHVVGPFPNVSLCYAAWLGLPHATNCFQGTSGAWYFASY